MTWMEFWSKLIGQLLDSGDKAIEHLAWPSVVLYILVKQKGAVAALFERLTELQLGSAKAKFDAKVEALAEKAEVLEGKPLEASQTEPSPPILEPQPQTVAPAAEAATANRAPEAQLGGTGDALSSGVKSLTDERESAAVPVESKDWSHLWNAASDDKLRSSGLIITEWSRLELMLRKVAINVGVLFADSDQARAVVDRLKRRRVLSIETAVLIKDLSQLRNEVAHSKFEPTQDAANSFSETCRKAAVRIDAEYMAWKDVQKLAKDWDEQFEGKK